MHKRFLITLCFLGFLFSSLGQKTTLLTTEISSYLEGMELFDKEKYSAAMHAFDQAMLDIEDHNSEVYVNSVYYKGMCALQLFNRDAEYQLSEFIRLYPESPRVKNAYFQLAHYNYRKKKWEKVIYWYNFLDERDLTKEERFEMQFRKGYAHYQENELDEAKSYFFKLIDIESSFYAPANYYYGHIAYQQGNYETALKTLIKLSSHPKFKVVVPYYITHIYYNQEKHQELIDYAVPMLEAEGTKRVVEISRLVGESHYHLEEWAQALPYLELYQSQGAEKKREDFYQLGYAYFRVVDYDNAVKWFEKVMFKDDALAQSAAYTLASAYLKQGSKREARTAYEKAYTLDFDQKISEDAMFNYAKLALELAYDPYNYAVDAFVKYLEKYPDSYRKEEAYNFLINIYLSINNYQAAIQSIEKLELIESRLQGVYQQLLYNSGIDQFQNQQFNAAIETLSKAQEQDYNKELSTQAQYWMAEAHYRNGDYNNAVDLYTEFILSPRAILLKEFVLAHYGLAYAYFDQKEYDQAASWFRKFVSYTSNEDAERKADAYIRTGDCYFIQKEYILSLEYYEKAVALGLRDPDYALYQYALATMVLKDGDKHIELLEKLTVNYPSSNYKDAAYYHLGKSYQGKGDIDKALAKFNQVIDNYPYSSFNRKSRIGVGSIYYNEGENDLALVELKEVVKEYPTYQQSKEAIRIIESIYKETGEISDYEEFIAELGFMQISDAALDSLTYEAAEIQIQTNQCGKAINSFTKYIDRFDYPIFALDAHYYRGDCLYKAEQFDEALGDFNFILAQPLNKFSEFAAVHASTINMSNKLYDEALLNYQQLETIAEYPSNKEVAYKGQMRCYYELEGYQEAIKYADMVLEMNKVETALILEAMMIKAHSTNILGAFDSAFVQFDSIVNYTNNVYAAEAKYCKAEIAFKQERYAQAEELVFDLVNHKPTYDYWLAKGMLLLANVYRDMGDNFQAKATADGVVKNFTGDPEIVDACKTLIEEIEAEEAQKESEEVEEPEIDLFEKEEGVFEMDMEFLESLMEEEIEIEEEQE